jgi:hypothetical protein
MRVPDHPTLIRRLLDSRLKKLATTTPVLAASLSSYTHRCGRPTCRCRTGGPLHTGQHLTFKGTGQQDPDRLGCVGVYRDDGGGGRQYFAWLRDLPIGRKTVEEVAQKGGRERWKVENEGFNRQKNSGLNLEPVYSTDLEKWKAYYLLVQIAFILVQLVERGSLLRRLAEEFGGPVWKLFGSLKNVA